MEHHNEDNVDARSPLIPDETGDDGQLQQRHSTTPPSMFDESALAISPTPRQSSTLYSRISAEPATNPGPLRRHGLLSWCRIATCVLLTVSGSAVIGCASHALHNYDATNLSSQWQLPLWPLDFDLRPTIAVLAGGVVILVMALVALTFAALSLERPQTRLLNTIFTACSLLGLAAAVVATAYSAYLNTSSGRDTLESWTCRWYHSGAVNSPSGFGRMCKESHAARDITALCICLEALAVGLAVEGWWVGREVGRKRKGAFKLEKVPER